jgi:hypothetical protein
VADVVTRERDNRRALLDDAAVLRGFVSRGDGGHRHDGSGLTGAGAGQEAAPTRRNADRHPDNKCRALHDYVSRPAFGRRSV